jgi:PAS domain S-box-containing protein
VESYQQELAQIKTILKNNPKGMTVTDIAREIRINRNSVAKYLDILLISGHAELVTFGPAKVYFPSSRIPLSAMLNFSHDYIILLNRDLKFIQVSDNLLKFLGMPRETIIGHSIETFSYSIFQIPELAKNARSSLDGKESAIDRDFPPDSKELSFHIKHIPTTFDDGEPGVTLIIEDITERKRTEEKMKQSVKEWETTFNSITDPISIQDDEFNIVRANNAFAEFLHIKPEDCLGKKCYELLHGVKGKHQSCPCIQIQVSKKPETIDYFEPYLGKHLEISASPIMDDNGQITGSVHIIKDITERKKK